MPRFGVIGGSGLYGIPGLEIVDTVQLSTPYGSPSESYKIGLLSGKEIAFLPRHGAMHNIQPHKINHRANIWGFRELGVERIISICASGGIGGEMIPGVIAVPDQLIDMTSGRPSTFYEEDEVVHIDFSEPFCGDLREYVFKAAEAAEEAVVKKGTYICVNGPRMETAAEIRAFSILGADMIGMTAMPEAVLARELEICLAGVSVITNFAAGRTADKLTTTEVIDTMQAASQKLRSLMKAFFAVTFSSPACRCGQTLQDAKM